MPEEIFCKICHSPFSREYIFKEMMFGTRDTFLYYECSGCGCLQIAEVPANIDKYYPPYYYAFNVKVPRLEKRRNKLRGIMQRIFLSKKEKKSRKQIETYLNPIQIRNNHKILDVGCGKGELICHLFNMGYESVEGTDKYLPEPIDYEFNVKVIKKELKEIQSDTYDLVMMHHVLEHMFYQEEELKECYRILKNGSFLIVRIPVKSYTWEKYHEHWVQLDAPRHFIIHTHKSMEVLAERVGFKIHSTVFDSVDFQFIGSELYKRDIPLYNVETHTPYEIRELFNKAQIKLFRKKAKKLNENGLGDQAVFYLYKQ